MEQITYKGSPIKAAAKYKEVNDQWAATSGGASSALGLLAATTYTQPCRTYPFRPHLLPSAARRGCPQLVEGEQWNGCVGREELTWKPPYQCHISV